MWYNKCGHNKAWTEFLQWIELAVLILYFVSKVFFKNLVFLSISSAWDIIIIDDVFSCSKPSLLPGSFFMHSHSLSMLSTEDVVSHEGIVWIILSSFCLSLVWFLATWRCMVIHRAVSGDYMELWLIEASHKRKISAEVQLPPSQGLLKTKAISFICCMPFTTPEQGYIESRILRGDVRLGKCHTVSKISDSAKYWRIWRMILSLASTVTVTILIIVFAEFCV